MEIVLNYWFLTEISKNYSTMSLNRIVVFSISSRTIIYTISDNNLDQNKPSIFGKKKEIRI